MTDNQYAPPDAPYDDKKPQPETCEPSYPDKPTYKPPKKCERDPACNCPPGSNETENCLETLIDEQTKPITDGDRAKAFKAELEAFLKSARPAKDEYTTEKYQKLVKLWEEQDTAIAELIRKLVCALPCWRCIIECHVCPLVYQIRDAELQLNGDGKWCTEVRDRQDLLYWQTRDKDAKERFFNRLKAILAAWEKPAQTLEKILADNAKAIIEANKSLGTEPSRVVYDVFLKLIPTHLAIKPSDSTSKVDATYTQFCCCDDRKPMLCCGIDVGEPSVRRRLIGGPLPFLIDPNNYFKLICCLVSDAYQPAKDKLSAAEAAVASTQITIKRLKDLVGGDLKNLGRAAVPIAIDCKTYEKKDPGKPDPGNPPCPCHDHDKHDDKDDSPSPKY